MAAKLPAKPNLDHLRKQAKSLLRAYRRNEPEAVRRFSELRLGRNPSLSDAKHVVAREYGLNSWPDLKDWIASATGPSDEVVQLVRDAFMKDDAAAFRRLVEEHPELTARINEPVAAFDSLLINHVRSPEMLDALLDAGADINARSRWWAGGFGLLDCADSELAGYAMRRGATATAHSAARLGDLPMLRSIVESDPESVHGRGGDGQTPLHFASTVEVAEFLVERGADVDARDTDHDSTPAQYMVRSRPDVARYLVRRGCRTDILMAAALGDVDLVQNHLDADPECLRMRVSDEYFPMVDSGKGGTIYQWELGWYVSACQVARAFGHDETFELLVARSPVDETLINACWLHEERWLGSLLHAAPGVAGTLTASGRRHVAHAARNNDGIAARLMLEAGVPAIGTFSQHHASALHWAAFHGNVELVRLILQFDPNLEDAENEFQSTPLGWAIYGSEHGWDREAGEYVATVGALLDAGARPPDRASGSRAVRAVLRQRRT